MLPSALYSAQRICSPSVRGIATEFSYTPRMVPRVASNFRVFHSTVHFSGKVIWYIIVGPMQEWASNERLDPLTSSMIQYYSYFLSLPHPNSGPAHPILPLRPQYQWVLGWIYFNPAQCNVQSQSQRWLVAYCASVSATSMAYGAFGVMEVLGRTFLNRLLASKAWACKPVGAGSAWMSTASYENAARNECI